MKCDACAVFIVDTGHVDVIICTNREEKFVICYR